MSFVRPVDFEEGESDLDDEKDTRMFERSIGTGVRQGGCAMTAGDFAWSGFEGVLDRDIKRERIASRTEVVVAPHREGSAPPVMENRVDIAEHESSSEDEMDELFDIRVQTLTEGAISTKDLRCTSCFVRYADVGVFPCGHVCTL